MKKFLLAVVSAAVLLIVPSAHYPTSANSLVGDDVPDLAVSNGNKSVKIGELRGSYLLLSFWSSTDPESRIANKAYNDLFLTENCNVKYVAINLDPSSTVFSEIVKIDNLDAVNQFYIDNASKLSVSEDFNLRSGYVSLLISPEGEVIAQNPSVDYIKSIA